MPASQCQYPSDYPKSDLISDHKSLAQRERILLEFQIAYLFRKSVVPMENRPFKQKPKADMDYKSTVLMFALWGFRL